MYKDHQGREHKIAVIIPAYNVEPYIQRVIENIPSFVDQIIVVDDKSTDFTIKQVEELREPRLHLIKHSRNQGVGGAVLSGYQQAFELGADIFVKMDGDNQMDPGQIRSLIEPIINFKADYTKGNRFLHQKELVRMPLIRRIGNLGLSFLTKLASGYWHIFDPTNGFTAINSEVYALLDKDTIAKDFFFETSMLLQLQKIQALVIDIPIPAKYENQQSNLSPIKILFIFPFKLTKGLFSRIYYQYFLFDFSAVSVYLTIGIPAIIFGAVWGIVKWVQSVKTGVITSTGTVLIAVLPIIIGVQFLTQAVSIDINNTPSISIREKY